jgi:hypothetical protein
MDMRFCTRNVRAGSLITVAKEIKYILQRQNGVVWAGLILLRIGTSGWFL